MVLPKRRIEGAEANGSGERLMPWPKVYAHGDENIVIEKKMAPVASKTRRKRGVVYGSHGNVGMKVEGLLGLC